MAKKTLDLKTHPEAVNNALKYFNYDNRIPQEVVPRYDRRESYLGPYDLTENDLIGLAVYANTILNKDLLRYNPRDACQDALSIAVRDKDNGKFDGKLNYNTYMMVLSYMMDLKNFNKEEKSSKKASEIEAAKKEKKKEKKDTVTLQRVKLPSRGEEVSKIELRKVLQGKPSKEITILKKKQLGLKEGAMDKYAAVTDKLDKIAAALEESQDPELLNLALQVDRVADEIEVYSKSAATLESDKDEPYMKGHFKDGLREGDKDEPYMKAFNVDKSEEVEKVKTEKGSIRKNASFPYQKVV